MTAPASFGASATSRSWRANSSLPTSVAPAKIAHAYPIIPVRLFLIYENVWLRAADGVRLHSWFIRHSPTYPGPTIQFFQEIAGNIADRSEFVRLMMKRLQCNVLMLSYRGYGESDGYPSQKGITNDAHAALDHLVQRKDIDTSRIVVFAKLLFVSKKSLDFL